MKHCSKGDYLAEFSVFISHMYRILLWHIKESVLLQTERSVY